MGVPSIDTSVWEVRPTNGTDTNGGGFDSSSAGTDYSQQNAKNTVGNNISTTDLVTTTTGSFTATSATAAFTTAITGNYIYLTGGTGGTVTTGWYKATYVSATQVNLDRSPGAVATVVTMNIGGAIKTIGQLITNMGNSNGSGGAQAWIKAEATITTTSQFNFQNFTNNTATKISGYTTTRGDNGLVTIQATASMSGSAVIQIEYHGTMQNILVDCNSQTTTSGFLIGTGGFSNRLINCQSKNGTWNNGYAFAPNGASATLINCIGSNFSAATGGVFRSLGGNSLYVDCVAYGGSTPGWNLTAGSVNILVGCIAANNSGASSDGFFCNSQQTIFLNCIAYTNGRDGFRIQESSNTIQCMQNCITYGNTGFGVNQTAGTARAETAFCAFG